jgi:hypothetical protein
VDEKAALAVKGVRQVVNIEEAVAVVADHMGAAKKGLAAAAITWDDGPNGKVSNADIVKQLEEESKKPGAVARNEAMQGRLLLKRRNGSKPSIRCLSWPMRRWSR